MAQCRRCVFWLVFLFSIVCSKGSNVVIIDNEWENILQGEWLVKFYAPWCPACRAITETWNELGRWATEDGSFNIGSVDITQQSALNGRFMITSLPTIYHVKNGVFRQYSSSRSLDDFKKFLVDETWKEISPVSGWYSPSSTLMNGVSKLFSLSNHIRAFQESMNTEYGLPSWIIFVLFGLVIIVVGLLLGVLLVLATDWMWPPVDAYEHKKVDDANTREDDVSEEQEEENVPEEDNREDGSSVRQRKATTEAGN